MDELKLSSDTYLWEQVTLGNEAAFAMLFERYWEVSLREALLKTGSEQDAMDCVQELFIKLWNNRAQISIQSSFKGYLLTALKHRVISYYRSKDAREHLASSVANLPGGEDSVNHSHHVLQAKEVAVLIESEVSRMPSKMQQVYRFSREGGLSSAQIAQQMGISEQTVKNQLTTALKRLKIKVVQYQGSILPVLYLSPVLYFQMIQHAI
ncbi:hypothetical protein COR50_00965 [Chitinophaga caeni]|uniref:RNA polymerase subunit sigma-70 n=1 Tax=Chitinophaga caeni TaxID=2029983 RepID=A0A291QPM3_9BACT|nr:sigma-70 family RNA polymerase sigma factor [Chitinophaga caeni]ATL45843.1 hypothetical protein COR50_00965 [Chitinophaga caeni]